MEILAARILIRPVDHARSLAFYRDELGLAIAREFPGGTVFFLGGGFLELSGSATGGQSSNAAAASRPGGGAAPGGGTALWMQVRDLDAAHRELVTHVVREPRVEPWGLYEMWIADPDGTRIVLVQIPADHPIRRDSRT